MKENLLICILLLFTVVFIVGIAFATISTGELGYGCEGNPCPAWVNITKGDMFFADDNQVFIVVNYTCTDTSVCNESMNVTGNFSEIGGGENVISVFKENATDYSWAVFELNDTVNLSACQSPFFEPISTKLIYLNATDGNTSTGLYNDEVNVTVFLVNMSYPPSCPPPTALPPQIPLLNGTFVNVSHCRVDCTVEDRAQFNHTNGTGTYYAICGPSFGGNTTNFTALADTGNFSNFSFIIEIPGKVKVNFTQNISADPSICEFSKNTMVGPYFGINDTEWNGTIKPNLNISAIITFYNVSKRFGFQGRPQIFRYPHAETTGVPCPPSICSDFVWDGENITFAVTSFSDYGMTDTINVTLQSPSNLSYSATKNINFTFIPEWNSSIPLHNCTLYGNFTGTWEKNETNQTPLVNGVINGINNTVAADGPYSWNVYCYNDSSQYDFYIINWTVIVDTTSPDWFTNSSSTPTNYSPITPSQFNITWNDTNSDIDTVLITIRNSTGIFVNNASMNNDTYGGQIYNYSILLPAETYNWTSYANDTNNNWNSTDTWSFEIGGQLPPTIYNISVSESLGFSFPSPHPLWFNENTSVSSGSKYSYGNIYQFNITWLDAGQVFFEWNETNNFTPSSEGNIFYYNISDLAAGNYTYRWFANNPFNWNSTPLKNFTINKGILDLSISASSTSVVESTETNFTGIESNDGDNDTVYELWRDSTKIDNTTPYEDVTDQLDAGTYIYRFNSTGGENWTANLTGVTKTLTVSDTTITPSPGGGKVPSFSDIKREKGMVNMTINRIDGNTTSNFSITKTEDIAIRKLSINVLNTVSNVKLVITKLSSLPPTISHNIDGKVYHYININHENINDTDINKTIIRFAVNKTWLNDNNVNSSNISLYRWEEYRWNELPVTFFYQDAFEILYEAESPGFSVFIIGTSGGSGEISEGACTESWSCTEWSVCVNSTQTRTCTDSNDCGTTVDKPAESQECQTLMGEINIEEMPITTIVSFALLLVVVIGALIFLKTKGKLSFISKEEEDTKEEYYY